ncbi:MAG: MgtC/SapB family protein [Thermacetogeniaceae bacterium]
MAVSLLVGLIIGYERAISRKPAGIRTYSLVCIGSTLFMIVSAYGLQIVPAGAITQVIDPGRVAAQIVTGIGFLGAGMILQDRGRVRGLTTAAEMWTTAALGMAIGLGLYVLTAISVVAVFMGLYSHNFFKWIGILPPEDQESESAESEKKLIHPDRNR